MTSTRPPEAFAALLVAYRRRAGLTQEILAEMSGLSVRGISDLERGARRAPYRDTVLRLAEALNLEGQDRETFLQESRQRTDGIGPEHRTHLLGWAPPQPLKGLVGRRRELREIQDRIENPEVRLVTLTGTGGTGKTRLAIEIALASKDRFAEGVRFLSLATVTDPMIVRALLLAALEPPDGKGGQSQPVTRDVLIVADNFEQVLTASTWIADILESSPGVTFLVTSRTRLNISGEWEFPIHPFAVEGIETPADLPRSDAVTLFVARARALDPGFDPNPDTVQTIAQICARLDGLPLAIELAAARIRTLSPGGILKRLDRRLPLLTTGPVNAPERQRTLRATIDWSYDLLDDDAKRLFRRLGVFGEGFTLDAARVVTAFDRHPLDDDALLEALGHLLDQSVLLRNDPSDDETRFRMLETLREYCFEHLFATGEARPVCTSHLAYYANLVRTAEPKLAGSHPYEWLDLLDREYQNIRMALRFATLTSDATGVEMAIDLNRYWVSRRQLNEGDYWYHLVLKMPGDIAPGLRARALACRDALTGVKAQ